MILTQVSESCGLWMKDGKIYFWGGERKIGEKPEFLPLSDPRFGRVKLERKIAKVVV